MPLCQSDMCDSLMVCWGFLFITSWKLYYLYATDCVKGLCFTELFLYNIHSMSDELLDCLLGKQFKRDAMECGATVHSTKWVTVHGWNVRCRSEQSDLIIGISWIVFHLWELILWSSCVVRRKTIIFILWCTK